MQTQNKFNLLTFILPLLVFLITVLTLAFLIWRNTGHLIYPIDDPYIHMAMARHFAEQQFLGVSLEGFSASSSAPGWTLLLGFTMMIFGSHEMIPFLFNVLFSGIVILLLTDWCGHIFHNRFMTIFYIVFAIFVLPLPTITCTGMEHPLHIVLILVLLSRTITLLTDSVKKVPAMEIALWGMLAAVARYETAFVIAPLCLVLFIRQYKTHALLLGLSYVLPIALIGLMNILQDWFFFPTSILRKSNLQHSGFDFLSNAGLRLYGQLYREPHLMVPFLLSLVCLWNAIKEKNAFHSRNGLFHFTFITATFLHCMFASIGWFYRYEAYLLAIAFIALAPLIRNLADQGIALWKQQYKFPERIAVRGIVLLIAVIPIIAYFNQAQSLRMIVPGAVNQYKQQYQMGLFLQKYYTDYAIVANDIGAINYLADIHCLDLAGLGSIEPHIAALQQIYNPQFLQSWCYQENASIAVIYEHWWQGLIPEHWVKVGEWTVDEKVTVADPTVSFFAIQPAEVQPLRQHLKDFKSLLPDGVLVEIF